MNSTSTCPSDHGSNNLNVKPQSRAFRGSFFHPLPWSPLTREVVSLSQHNHFEVPRYCQFLMCGKNIWNMQDKSADQHQLVFVTIWVWTFYRFVCKPIYNHIQLLIVFLNLNPQDISMTNPSTHRWNLMKWPSNRPCAPAPVPSSGRPHWSGVGFFRAGAAHLRWWRGGGWWWWWMNEVDDDDTQSLWLEVFCAICFVSLRVGVVFFRCWCESLRSDPPWLVGGLEHGFYFPEYIGNNHPNWRTHIFQRGRYTTNHQFEVLPWPTPNPPRCNGTGAFAANARDPVSHVPGALSHGGSLATQRWAKFGDWLVNGWILNRSTLIFCHCRVVEDWMCKMDTSSWKFIRMNWCIPASQLVA